MHKADGRRFTLQRLIQSIDMRKQIHKKFQWGKEIAVA